MKKTIFITLLFLIFSGCLAKTMVEKKKSLNSSNNVIVEAKKHLGKPYQYGKIGPNSFDCSGFVYAIYKKLGKEIPRSSLAQSKITGKKLSKDELQEGDMVFFDTSLKGKINHSGIYLGKGKFIHSSSGKAYSVTISDLNAWYKDKFKWGKRKK